MQDVIKSFVGDYSQERVTVSGLDFIKIVTANEVTRFLIERQDVLYYLSWGAGDEVVKETNGLFNQILSTFRFAK